MSKHLLELPQGHLVPPLAQAQTPAAQTSPTPHFLPQTPQLLTSSRVLVHLPAQGFQAEGQAQPPFWQVVPPPQTVPQWPQFVELVWGSTQTPAQRFQPAGQGTSGFGGA